MASPLKFDLAPPQTAVKQQPVEQEIPVTSLTLLPEVRIAPDSVDQTEALKQNVDQQMRHATAEFMMDVSMQWRREPREAEGRPTTVSFIAEQPEKYALSDDWRPATVAKYNSNDPWQRYNPELTAAMNRLVESTMDAAEQIRQSGSLDPTLTYFDSRRANGGKRATLITSHLIGTDEAIGDWITGLPAAERLRPVAHPWSDTTTVLRDKEGNFQEIPLNYALNAVVGGANDGRAVREREAWEHEMVKALVDSAELPDNTLRITSLGTGTGEPAMDTGLAFVADEAKGGRVVVSGFDINQNSLAIAAYLVEQKQQNLEADTLVFNGGVANLLSKEGIAEAVSTTKPQIIESIGFSEYVPSDNAPTTEEQQQRKLMKRIGGMSAEAWYGTIYDNMPEGSIWLTGNMRADSPQLSFVINGLGWQGIIARSTEEYLHILKNAGIPGEAVNLFVPGEESTGVYNLVAITKPRKTA